MDWSYVIQDTGQWKARLIRTNTRWTIVNNCVTVCFSRNLSHAVSLDVDIKGKWIRYLDFILEIMVYLVHICDASCSDICHRPHLVRRFSLFSSVPAWKCQPASQPMPRYLSLNELITIGPSEQLHILINYFRKKIP